MSAPDERMYAVSTEVIGKIRDLRKMQKLSAQDLSDRMADAGFVISRSAIANQENGRKVTVTVDFADAAARVLGMDLVSLLLQPVTCPTCHSKPPAGFACNTCGGAA